MAAILQLRRGTSNVTLTEGELYLHQGSGSIQFGSGSDAYTLVKIGSNTGDVSFSGALGVTGISTLGVISGSNLHITDNATIKGNLTLGGSIYLGDGTATDEIIVNASLSGSLIPDTTLAYDLGSSTYKYRNLYVQSASIDNVTFAASNIVSSSQQISDYNVFLEIGGDSVVSGSSQINLTQTTNYISGIKTRLNAETVISGSSQIDALGFLKVNGDNVISGSSQVQIDSVTGFTSFSSSVDSRLDNLESDSTELFSTASDHESRIDAIEGYSSSLDSRLDYLEGEFSTSVDIRIDSLESFSSSLDNEFLNTNGDNVVSSSQQISDYNVFLEINGMDVVSGSSQIDVNDTENFQTFSSSVDTRLDLLENFSSSQYNNDSQSFDSRLDTLEGSFSTSVDLRLDNAEFTGSDHETRITSIEGYSASLDIRLDDLELTGSEHESRLDTIETTFSSSVDLRLDNAEWTGSDQESRLDIIETTFSSSVDSRLDLLENFSSSEYITDSSSFDQRVDYLEASQSYFDDTFSGSVDLRLSSIEGDLSSSIEQQLTSIHSYTSSLKTAINTSGTDLIVYGNLTVQGTQTSLNTSQTYIEDLAITLASGALDGAEANGAGIEIAGANQSLTWDNPNLQWVFTGQVSASSFIGDGSNLENVTAAEIEFANILNKPTLVSGSFQISFNGIVDKPTLFSGSSQVNADSITNFDSNVKDKLNNDLVHSGSYLGTATTSNLTEGIQLYYTDTRVKNKLNVEGVLSGSSQITDGSGIVSSSQQISNYNKFLEINGDNVVSASSQIDLKQTTNYESGILERLNIIGVFSQSSQVNADSITNFDTNVKDKLNIETVISGSSQIDLTQTSNYVSGIKDRLNVEGVLSGSYQVTESLDLRYLKINGDTVFSSSIQVDADSITNFDTNVRDVLNNDGIISSSIQVTESLDTRYLQINGDSVVSGSSQISFNGIIDKPSLISGSTQVILSNTNGYSAFSASLDSRLDSLELDQHNHTNKSNLDSINQDLSTTDKPTFENINLPNLTLLPSASEFSVLLYSQSGEIAYSELGTAAYYHVSQSISNGDSDVIGTAAAIKDYIDEQLVIIGAGDITEVIAGDGLGGGAESGPATLTLDTGSQHFTDGVLSSLPSGIISGSTFTTLSSSVDSRLDSLELFSSSLDDDFVTQVELASATGSLINSIATKLDTSSYNTDSQSFDSRLDTLEGETHENPLTFTDTATIDFTRINDTITANVIGGVVSGSQQVKSLLPIGTVSGSSQVVLSNTNGYTSFSSSIDNRLDNQESFSSSIDGTIKTKLNVEGVISGSSQVNADSITNFDSNVLDKMNVEGIISGSSQVEFNDISGNPFESASVQGFQVLWIDPTLQYILPTTPNYTSLGAPGAPFKELFLSGNTIDLGGTLISRDALTGNIIFTDSGSGVSVSADVDFDTITNKPTLVSSSQQISNYNTFLEINGMGVISGSDQVTGSLVDLISDQTISGTKTFNDIVVNGTGSFAYITSVAGDAKIIGDAYIILNNDTPTQRYAGVAVYDSGSATPTTASFNFDGQTNDWFYEYSASTVDYGVVLFGPEYNTKGNPTYLTANRIPKAEGTHHLNDSNITDSGTLITLGSNVQVNGNISITGTVDSVDVALLKSEFDTLKGKTLVSGSSQVNHDSTTGFVPNEHIDHSTVSITAGDGLTGGGTIAATRTLNVVSANNGIVVNADNIELSTSSTTFTSGVKTKLNLDGVISGSSQTTLSGDVTGAANANTVGKIQGIAITSGEATQLANINTTTISATQWGYLGGLDQALTTTSTVQFGKVGIGGASDATYELKVTGDIGATGDVVAYISSDRRLKDEITPIQNSLQKINSIGGYSFVWNENQHIYKGKDYGVIAQEIEEILPELVETRENGYKAVKYDRIVSLLIEGIKELSKEVSELKEKIGK